MIEHQLLQQIDTPPDTQHYSTITAFDLLMLYGVKIQTAYDHTRIKIHDKYSPIRVQIADEYFYGVKLKPTARMSKIFSRICSVPIDHNDHVNMYRERLKMYGLTCDDCWRYLKNKIYPLDSSNMDQVAINSNYNATDLLMTDDQNLPWFTQYADFKIFVLNNK